MGIRLKIALGFALLTIVVVSVVSFWAAQSLGFSLDSSDLSKLETIKEQLLASLFEEQRDLDQLAVQTAAALVDTGFMTRKNNLRQRQAETIKSALSADWLEVYKDSEPLIFAQSTFKIPDIRSGLPVRIADSGPYSYRGYLFSQTRLPQNSQLTLCLARLPLLKNFTHDFFCIFDAAGILIKRGPAPELSILKQMQSENVTHQLKIGEDMYRIRIFKIAGDLRVLTGYPAQRATLSRSLVDQLMLRLAILEVVGLLLLGFFLGRKLFAPLGALRHGIEQVADGHWKEIPLNKPPMQNSGDEIENVALSFNRMVRELSSAQTRLIDVQKELAKKDKMAALGRFSAGIAHEINNPLGTILVTASMLKEAAAAGKQVPPEDFDAILDEVRRCRDIIATLRTYTGRTQPQLIKMNFSELMRQISDFLENEASFKDLLINISLPDQPDRKVLADIKAMYQVFNNLVKNSAEAMSDMPEKRLNLIAEIMSDHFIIKIQDYGRGFECLPEHIFEPLFTTKPQGTGLGLIICQAIIDGHHGRIEATRLENSITEFSIMLPFAEPDTLSKEEK